MGNSFPLLVSFEYNNDGNHLADLQDLQVKTTQPLRYVRHSDAHLSTLSPTQRMFTSTKASTGRGDHAFDQIDFP